MKQCDARKGFQKAMKSLSQTLHTINLLKQLWKKLNPLHLTHPTQKMEMNNITESSIKLTTATQMHMHACNIAPEAIHDT